MRISRRASAVVVQTPAKLNLFLEIFSRRSDGYHELETLMVAINIYDTLIVTFPSGRDVHLSCGWSPGLEARRSAAPVNGNSPWEALPSQGGNLVTKAIERLRQRAGVEMAANIQLWKRIPAAAGLGGASSDAAAALVAANVGWNLRWPRERLAEIASELGSDIPFFLTSGAAICRGRGEQIEPVSGPRLDFVVVRPPAGLSTAAVYKNCRVSDTPQHATDAVAAWQRGDRRELGRRLHNQLQPAAESLSPWIARLRAVFQKLDVLGQQMSGSGSSYFALCRHARHARQIAGRLRTLGLGAVYCASSERSPSPT